MTGMPPGFGGNREFSPDAGGLKPLDQEDWDKGPPPSQHVHIHDAPVAQHQEEAVHPQRHKRFRLYQPGMDVYHNSRGRGVVVAVEGDRDDGKVVVRFERRVGLADQERLSVCDLALRPCGLKPSTRQRSQPHQAQPNPKDGQVGKRASRRPNEGDRRAARQATPRREAPKPGRDATRLNQDNSTLLDAPAFEQRLAPGSMSIEEFKRKLEQGRS